MEAIPGFAIIAIVSLILAIMMVRANSALKEDCRKLRDQRNEETELRRRAEEKLHGYRNPHEEENRELKKSFSKLESENRDLKSKRESDLKRRVSLESELRSFKLLAVAGKPFLVGMNAEVKDSYGKRGRLLKKEGRIWTLGVEHYSSSLTIVTPEDYHESLLEHYV